MPVTVIESQELCWLYSQNLSPGGIKQTPLILEESVITNPMALKKSAIMCKDYLPLNSAAAQCFPFVCPLFFCIAFYFPDISVNIFPH